LAIFQGIGFIAIGQFSSSTMAVWRELKIEPNSVTPQQFQDSEKGAFDIYQKPSFHSELNKFRKLNTAAETFPLNITQCSSRSFQPSGLQSKPLHLKMCELGAPEITKTTIPQMMPGATGPILLFNKDHGVISDPQVNCIAQDTIGRIWIGTNRGISVYDGEYSYSYQTIQGLSDNRVWSIVIDHEGLIWIGTYFGLDVIDTRNNTISHVNASDWLENNYGFTLTVDSQDRVWFGTIRGLFMIDKSKSSIQKFGRKDGLISEVIRSLYVDSGQKVWVGTTEGLSIIDIEKRQIISAGEAQGIPKASVNCLKEKSPGKMYFGNNQGLFLWDIPQSEVLRYSQTTGFPDEDIRSVNINHMGIVFVGTRNKGIIVLNDSLHSIKTIWRQEGLSSDYVPFVFFDLDRQLWTGGFTGIHLIKKRLGDLFRLGIENGLRDQNSYAIMEDDEGNMWMGGKTGIDIYLKSQDEITYLNPSDIGGRVGCKSLFQDSKGIIYIGTFGNGLIQYDPKTKTWVKITQRNGLGNNGVSFTLEDGFGNIWIGSQGGINLYNPSKNSFVLINKYSGLPDDIVVSGEVGNNNEMWFSGDFGVIKFVPKTNSWYQLEFMKGVSKKLVNSVVKDSFGRIWLGTDEDGMYVYGADDTLRKFDQNLVSINRNILGLMSVGEQMYVTTPKSLTVIDQRNFSVKNFDKTQGLPSTDFIQGANAQSDDNHLWWGLVNGISVLKPEPLESRIAETRIISMEVNGVKQSFSNECLRQYLVANGDTLWSTNQDTFFTRESLWDSKKGVVEECSQIQAPYYIPENMVLDYQNNHVTFYYSGMQVNEPNHVRYTYFLEGLDKEWSSYTSDNRVEYRNLAPGQYTFYVTSCGISEGCGRPSMISFTILPPFWQTNWFYLLMAVGLLMFIYFYNSYRENIFKIHTQELEAEVAHRTNEYKIQKERAEKSEILKQKFLSNMSHEIRTPMNAVIGLVNILIDMKPTKSQLNYLNIIKKSSENLLVILNDILDLGKIEAGKMKLEHIDINLKEILDLVVQTLQFKAEDKGLLLVVDYDDSIPEVLLGDPTRLNQILINLVGNAIKFTEKGQITLGVKNASEGNKTWCKLRFWVRDTGIGMNKSQLNRIFKNFTQASNDTTRKYGGTGLGLSISKHLIELFGGEIFVQSEPGKGSEFFFTILLEKSQKSRIDTKARVFTPGMAEEISGIKVLIVEDNEYNRIVARDTLKLKIPNAEIFEAENGQEAVEKVRESVFDVVLMDMHMPIMDGMEATVQIRKFNSDIPIVAFTASVVKRNLDKYTKVGINGFISKPFRTDDLLLGIYHAINKEEIEIQEVKNGNNLGTLTNLEFLRDFVENDTEKLKSYISIYLRTIRKVIEQLESQLANNDFSETKSLVHSIRPQLKYMGMDNTAELAQEIENYIETENDLDNLRPKITQLIENCRQSVRELEKKSLQV
jgi:signal transduction histidine kinase/ligand-binding sensor domain-containing protein/CheY-like chemotaxis protein